MYRTVKQRESQGISTRELHRRVSAESDLVQRLKRQRLLDGHDGCVNTAVDCCPNKALAIITQSLNAARFAHGQPSFRDHSGRRSRGGPVQIGLHALHSVSRARIGPLLRHLARA